MPLESAPQNPLGRIDPSSLIGKPDTSIVEPKSVAALADAFRSGFITTDDILQRAGEVGHAKRKLELQTLGAQTSPAGAAAQAAQIQQAGAQATLGTAQAQTALPLVPQQGQVAKSQLDEAQANTKYGTGVADFRALAPLVPGFETMPLKPDGSPDYDLMGVEGNYLKSIYNQKLLAQQRLTPVRQEKTTGPGGQTGFRSFNALGEDVTPHPENPTFKQWNQIAAQPLSFRTIKPGGTQTAPTGAAPEQPAAAAPMIEPRTEDANRARAAMVESGQLTPEQAVQVPNSQVGAPSPKPMIAPKVPNLPPGETPPSTETLGTYDPGLGVVTGAGEVPKPQDITDQVRKQKSYEAWNASKPFYNAMANTIQQINQIPLADQRAGKVNLNAQDIELVSNFVKLYDPNAVIREFKFDKIEHSQPFPDQLKNWMSTITRNGQLTPETRQQLFRVATEAYRAKEQSIVPDLQMAAQRAQAAGYSVNHILNPEEQQLLSGKNTATYNPPGAAGRTATGGGGVKTLTSGLKVQQGADGKWYKVSP
jgi:hypothetical protein